MTLPVVIAAAIGIGSRGRPVRLVQGVKGPVERIFTIRTQILNRLRTNGDSGSKTTQA
jgi:hypothetical protein